MSDDLAAFFAKKAQKKSKKKNVVSLDDVGQQLERRVRIQETGEPDIDENVVKETNENVFSKSQQNNEDSEWIEVSEKPSIVGLTFKEFTENPEDTLDEQKKRANNETNKTWNIVDKTADLPVAVDTPPAKPAVKSTYQAPSQRRAAPLDITSQEMFPSIAHAEEIAEKLKVEEKKKAIAPVKTEEQFQEKKSVWRPRISADAGNNSAGSRFESQRSGGGPPSGGGYRSGGYESSQRSGGYESNQRGGGYDSSQRSGGYDSSQRGGGYDSSYRSERFGGSERPASGGRRHEISNDGTDEPGGGGNWRGGPRASAPSSEGRQPYSQSSINSGGVPDRNAAEDSGNWRSNKVAVTPSPVAPTPSPAATSTTAPAAPQKKKYVPPSQRGQATST